MLSGARVESAGTVGQTGDHLKLQIQSAGGIPLTALAFRMGDRYSELQPGTELDLVGYPVANEFNGQKSLEWHVTDFRPT